MKTILIAADIPPLLLATVLAVYGAYILVFGAIVTFVSAEGTTMLHQPIPAGVIPVLAGVLVWLGVGRGSNRIAWVGGAVGLMFSVLFVFSSGGIMVPIAVLLVVSLAVRHVSLG